MTSPIDLGSLEPIEIAYSIQGKNYTLREASESAAIKWRDRMMQGLRIGESGKIVGFSSLSGAEPLLVHLCLFDGENKNVPLSVVEGWPSRVVKVLHEKAKEISDLGEEENDPDPEIIDLCRKDLSAEHHPDKGGNPDTMIGVNLTLDWMKKWLAERAKRKNSGSGGQNTSDYRTSSVEA